MTFHPMRMALGRVCKRAFLRRGQLRIIEDLRVTPLCEHFAEAYGEEAGRRIAWVLHATTRAEIASSLGGPTCRRLQAEVSTLITTHRRAAVCAAPLVHAWSNSGEARGVSRDLEREVLPPLWQRRRGGVWAAGTPLGEVRYECLVERQKPHAHVVLFVENGPVAAIDPAKLFSIWTLDYLCFEDVAVYAEHYRCFLLVLNAFIAELRDEIAACSELPEEA